MLGRLFQLFLQSPQPPALLDHSPNQVVLYARIGASADSSHSSTAAVVAGATQTSEPSASFGGVRGAIRSRASHRERLLSMKLEHTKLCSPHRCQRLMQLGIVTAGDLASANPDRVARQFVASRKAVGVIKRYRRAIRLAAAVPGMMPRDAMLLVSIHRRSVRGLASESPVVLHRDLERYAASSIGRQQLRGRRIPSARRVKRWIAECEHIAIRTPLQARVA